MKKIRSLIAILITGMLLISCSKNNSGESDIAKNKGETNNSNTNIVEEKTEEVKKTLTIEELNSELSKLPILITHTEYIVQDPELKSLYPDALNVVFQNNSGKDVKDVVLGLVAWDENNFPVKIQGEFINGKDYYVELSCSDANMINGATYGEDQGLMLDEDNNINKFKAIVVSYTDFDGNTWDNELLDDFKELYYDKKLLE